MKKLLRFVWGHEPDVEALSAHLDGALDARESARLDAHLASCDACSGALEGLRTARTALGAMPDVDPPRSFRLRAVDVERFAATPVNRSPVGRWAPLAAGFAALAFAIVIGGTLYANRTSDSKQTAAGALSAQRANGPSKAAVETSAASDSGARTTENAPAPALPPDASTTPSATTAPAAGVAAPDTAQPTLTAAEAAPNDAYRYAATATTVAREAARPAATATSELQAAAGQAAPDDHGNNSTALRVTEIIAVGALLAAAAIAFVWWRRGERRS